MLIIGGSQEQPDHPQLLSFPRRVVRSAPEPSDFEKDRYHDKSPDGDLNKPSPRVGYICASKPNDEQADQAEPAERARPAG
jgi:hypothetical protein